MKYSEARQGRVFVIRLEDGEVIHEEIEAFARDKGIGAAAVIILGGADEGSKLVVGPEHGRVQPISPMSLMLDNVCEVTGVGTIFPDPEGAPILHAHISCGRENTTVTGCIRGGVKVWNVIEVILFELMDTTGIRIFDSEKGFSMLNIKR